MNAGKHRPFLLVMLASFFLLDSQEAWEINFPNQHQTWMIKIRPCKEPVDSFLEVVVCVIILVAVPVIIIHVHERKLHDSKCLSSRGAKHKPFRFSRPLCEQLHFL